MTGSGDPRLRSAAELAASHCTHLGRDARLSDEQLHLQLAELPRWSVRDGALQATYTFANYHRTIEFVNALAEQVHAEDHHPDLAVGYDRCTVRWSTHSAGGITLNDLVCAAKSDAVHALLQGAPAPTPLTAPTASLAPTAVSAPRPPTADRR
jgi:4a-hydroxytetrahydrobiopterin dehydratase